MTAWLTGKNEHTGCQRWGETWNLLQTSKTWPFESSDLVCTVLNVQLKPVVVSAFEQAEKEVDILLAVSEAALIKLNLFAGLLASEFSNSLHLRHFTLGRQGSITPTSRGSLINSDLILRLPLRRYRQEHLECYVQGELVSI
jgi:hypothetical protein